MACAGAVIDAKLPKTALKETALFLAGKMMACHSLVGLLKFGITIKHPLDASQRLFSNPFLFITTKAYL